MIKLTQEIYYLPSGRVFVGKTQDGYKIEFTEMRDVAIDGKLHKEVREETEASKIWEHLVPYKNKWLLTVSTQKGCTFNCKFCDVASLKFKGNLTSNEILDQVKLILKCSPYVKKSDKVKIGFARMGEPAMNLENVLQAMERLPEISKEYNRDFKWLPCFNSILPQNCGAYQGFEVIREVINVKEKIFDGFLHFQISCNSTDENIRHQLFQTKNIIPVDKVIEIINNNYIITNRTITLNFIVMKNIPVEVDKLLKWGLNPDKFTIKLIPLNKTNNAQNNNLEAYANYSNYEDLIKLSEKFKKEGIPVIYDAIAKCEEAGLCCGQLVNKGDNHE